MRADLDIALYSRLMPYSARAIANYFLELADKKGVTLSPMKLQKLVYYAHGWNLAISNDALIDEHVEAWRFGPVIPSLYHEFKDFGAGPIRRRATELRIVGTKFHISEPSIEDILEPEKRDQTAKLLDKIWEVYAPFSDIQLSNMTHADGSPWAITWAKSQGRKHTDIDDELIKDYFVRKAQENERARK